MKINIYNFKYLGIRMSLADFTIVKKLGSGSFSEVFHVKRRSDNAEYAMKKVKL